MDQTHLAPDSIDEATAPYLGRWHRLVSTTNWEKGRIIHEWRAALLAADAPAVEYSDDAWSRRVGSVSGQHAGRLRRVYERFGDVHETYEGLYWSHFQSAIDWNDAEMWLEGALQNRWSVAEMRRERWQALGGAEADHLREGDVVIAELDEDADSVDGPLNPSTSATPTDFPGHQSNPVQRDGRTTSPPDEDSGSSGRTATDPRRKDQLTAANDTAGSDLPDPASAPFRPFSDLPSLPHDVSEAFESFKLAILRHKTAGWQEVAPGDLLRCLDALKALVTAPA